MTKLLCFQTYDKLRTFNNKIIVFEFYYNYPNQNGEKTTYNNFGNDHANVLCSKGFFIWRWRMV